MKTFETVRRHLTLLGVVESMPTNQAYPSNRSISFGVTIFVTAITSSAMHLVYFSDSIREYIECFCVITASIEIGLCSAAIVLQKPQLFRYMDSVEELIDKSKRNALAFNRLNGIQWKNCK